ncbi:MAG: hypothetical protein O7H39_00245 [Gammaproteobacteria bacterium]|nr:hypothetical protein [Gammaproteobacteria bacterium]
MTFPVLPLAIGNLDLSGEHARKLVGKLLYNMLSSALENDPDRFLL